MSSSSESTITVGDDLPLDIADVEVRPATARVWAKRRTAFRLGQGMLAALLVVPFGLLSNATGTTDNLRTAYAGELLSHPAVVLPVGADPLIVESGEYFVPESRADASDRIVSIPFYRLRSTAAKPAAPIFLVAGGPGVSGIEDVHNNKDWRRMALLYRGIADVIVFDQRGAGRSRPKLDCPQRVSLPLNTPMTLESYSTQLREQSIACRRMWEERGADLTAYNTAESAADIDALRVALGYNKIALVGGSYGSHLSLAVLRQFPKSIERAVLHGVVGPDHIYDLPSEVLAALARLAADAERSEHIGPHVPPGGLIQALVTVLQRLERAPLKITVQHRGEPVEITLGKYDIQRLAFSGARDREKLDWPARIIAMYHGDFSSVASYAIYARNENIDSAMHTMMDCSSGLSKRRLRRLRSDPVEAAAAEIMGDVNIERFATCAAWGSKDLGKEFRSNVVSSIPTLIIQGSWDVLTPVANGNQIAADMGNAHVVRVEGGTHRVLYDLVAEWQPAEKLLKDFLVGKEIAPPHIVQLPAPSFSRLDTVSPRVARIKRHEG